MAPAADGQGPLGGDGLGYWSTGETVVRRVRLVYVLAAFWAGPARLDQEMAP